jgi:hypothetical protein
MESSLQAQGAVLKAASSIDLPVLGYIEGLSAQQYYVAQNALMHDPQYSSLLLRINALGLIDCYRDGCNWQGVEFRQYDLRQATMRDYYTARVLGDLISSPSLDGTFIDVIVSLRHPSIYFRGCSHRVSPRSCVGLVGGRLRPMGLFGARGR